MTIGGFIIVLEVLKAQQLVESVFTCENVGDEMIAVKHDPSLQTAQDPLVKALIDYASHLVDDEYSESFSLIAKATENRVQQFAAA